MALSGNIKKKHKRASLILQKGEIIKMLLFYINDLIDLVDKVNYTQGEEYKQLSIYDVLENIDNLEDEQDIQRAIKELEMRVQ